MSKRKIIYIVINVIEPLYWLISSVIIQSFQKAADSSGNSFPLYFCYVISYIIFGALLFAGEKTISAVPSHEKFARYVSTAVLAVTAVLIIVNFEALPQFSGIMLFLLAGFKLAAAKK